VKSVSGTRPTPTEWRWKTPARAAQGWVAGQPHGLRKAAAVRLAEAGATSQEIMAITGHTTLAEMEPYTRDAARKRLAERAMARLEPRKARGEG
jgi:integrase